jgi:hypothetical protein
MRYLIFFSFLTLCSCKSCVHNLYGTNSVSTLDIQFENSKIKGIFLKYYIDSVLNRNIVFEDSIKSIFYLSNAHSSSLPDNVRLIHFKEYPEEWYLIGFEIRPCWIKAIYNNKISTSRIDDINQFTKDDVLRIKKRVQIEILNAAEFYAKRNNIPDSIVYIK